MWTRILALLKESLGGSSSPWDSEEGREFFQKRLTLLSRVGFVISMAAIAFRAGSVLLLDGKDFLVTFWRAPFPWQFGSAVILFLAWRLLAWRQMGPGALHLIDGGIGLLLCSYFSNALWLTEPLRTIPDKPLLAATHILLFRAIIIPSTAAWTLVLGLLCSAPVVAFSSLTLPRWIPRSTAFDPRMEGFYVAQWMLIAVAVSTLTSALIYRLRRNVHEARKLGQYTLEEKLGEGGMGVVYKARHAFLRRPTAVKLLRPEGASEASIARFEREVQLTSRLTHPNTIAIYDYGRTPDGIFYYAMEYLEGLDLERLVQEGGPLPPARAVHLLRQVVSSLVEAHESDLIHRDIKPANVLLCERGGYLDVAKVVDFGLVKSLSVADPSLSGSDIITGTPFYMAPEAIQDPLSVDARTDLYAVGALAYEVVSGRRPFEGRNVVEVLSQQISARPEPPSRRLGRPLPADLESLILECLEKEPGARPQTARALLGRLESLADAGRWTQEEARACWRERPSLVAPPAAPSPAPPWATSPTLKAGPRTITGTARGR